MTTQNAAKLSPVPLSNGEETAQAVLVAKYSPGSGDPRPNPHQPLPPSRNPGIAVGRIEEQIARCSAEVAIAGDNCRFTYREVGSLADSVAEWLSDRDLLPGDIVAVHSGRNAVLAPILLGVWKAGLAVLVLDSSYPDSSILERLRIAKPKAWIDAEAGERLAVTAYLRTQGATICSVGSLQPAASTHPCMAGPDGLAYLAFTSGSTGTPRGVLGTHLPLAHFVNWQINEFGLQSADRFAMLSGIGHDPLLRDILTPLSLGATLHVPDDGVLGDPRAFASWMLDQRISVAHITPSRAQILVIGAALLGRPLASLRYLFTGGEALPVKLAEACNAAAPNMELVNFYGATETPQAIGYHRCHRDSPGDGSVIPLGLGIDGVQVLVVDSGGALAEAGQEGEIWIRTPYLSKGYLNDPVATHERFVVNPFTGVLDDLVYKTGDLGAFLHDGQVEFRRRNDRQIKVRGYRVEPAEIESAMERHPGVQCAIVIPIESPDGTELAGCFVAADPAGSLSASEIKQYLATRLPRPLIPSRILALDQFPVTSNGKVDRSAIEAKLARQGSHAPNQIVSPVERSLMDLWTQVLGSAAVGVEDNFFDLGGTSLTAARIVAEVERSVSLKVPLSLLVECPTIRSFAARLNSGDLRSSWNPLILLNPGDPALTPLFLVHAIGGNVVGYFELSRQLGDRPIYALQSPSLCGPAHDTTIQQMARTYIDEIRAVRPHGPYHLGGYSAGGLVAFEMAHQLRAAGERIASVCLLDTQDPLKPPLHVILATKIRKNVGMFLGLSFSGWRTFLTTKLVNLRMNLQVLSNRLDRGREAPESANQAEVQFRIARRKYHPEAYDNPVVLFLTVEEDEEILNRTVTQWESLVPSQLAIDRIPGNHDTFLVKPNVAIVAQRLREVLALHN